MADTSYLKMVVEDYVRETLAKEFAIDFRSRVLTLQTGGHHEFDAVSEDGQIVAAIKSARSGSQRSQKYPRRLPLTPV